MGDTMRQRISFPSNSPTKGNIKPPNKIPNPSKDNNSPNPHWPPKDALQA